MKKYSIIFIFPKFKKDCPAIRYRRYAGPTIRNQTGGESVRICSTVLLFTSSK